MKLPRLDRMLFALAGVLLAAALGLTATACSVPRGGATATSNVEGCAAVLPLARDTVRAKGTLVSIRRVNKSEVDDLTHQAGVTPPPPPPTSRPPRPTSTPTKGPRLPKACLVVYRGTYPPGAIAGASPPATSGHYALIILNVRHPAVYRVLVTDQLPPAAASN